MLIITRRFCSLVPKAEIMFALNYTYVEDVLNRRNDPWDPKESGGITIRQKHFEFIQPFATTGQVVMGGAYDPPSDGALIILNVKSKEEAEKFANNDPYVLSGIVKKWNIKPWTVVVNSTTLKE